MASREKKPLAPSKAKQKANNESGLSSNEIKSRKGKTLSNLKQQQLARDILEAVATGSQLPPKLEASLPRKKVLRNLKRKQKLRVAKANLIKSKVPRKVANRNLCRLTSDVKKSVRTKRAKLSEESGAKAFDNNSKVLEQQISEVDIEGAGTETINRSAKNNLRTKKTKFVTKSSEEIENEDTQDKDTDSVAGSSSKNSPKFSRKGKGSDSPDSLTKTVKSTKFPGFKRSGIRDKDGCSKSTEGDAKLAKGKKSNSNKDTDCGKVSNVDTKFSKSLLEAKSSIDLTIDEVIASMLSDSEIDSQQGVTEKVEAKVTRSRKMLVEDSTATDVEIKKEPDREETKSISDGENLGTESIQNAIQLRKRSSTSIGQRSLRNGKLRQSDSGLATDPDQKRRRRLNSDDPGNSEVMVDNITDSNLDTESCFSEFSGSDPHTVLVAAKDEPSLKQETVKNCDDSSQNGSETENNNNSDRLDRVSEIGPTLRSKTKAKSTEVDVKNDNIKAEYTRIAPKSTEAAQEDVKKVSNLDQVRKDNILAKFADKSKSRRSSLNIDMKKTVNSFYSTDKSDKSQLDQMIEIVKLNIVKAIESKIYGVPKIEEIIAPEKGLGLSKNFEVSKIEEIIAPEKGLGLSKNFEVPKIEEIVAPEKGLGLSKNFEVPKIEEIIAQLSTDSQKLGLDENTDEEESAITKNEMKSDSSETNIVPKVVDTAKEIEKLVMGDIEPAETHSQNIQESESHETDENNTVRNNTTTTTTNNSNSNASESMQVTENSTESTPKIVEQPEQPNENSAASEEPEKSTEQTNDQTSKTSDDAKKTVAVRKSPRISDKGSPESSEIKKPSKIVVNSKAVHNEESPREDTSKHVPEETILNEESAREIFESPKPVADSVPLESSSNDTENADTVQVQQGKEDEVEPSGQPVESRPEDPPIVVSANTEEAETLESISKEVERLVAEDQLCDQHETNKGEPSVEDTAASSASRTMSSNEAEDAAVNKIVEELESSVEQETPKTTEHVKEAEPAASETQDTEHDRNNSHMSDCPSSGSDSKEDATEDSSEASVPVQEQDSIQDPVQDSIQDSVQDIVQDTIQLAVRDSVRDSKEEEEEEEDAEDNPESDKCKEDSSCNDAASSPCETLEKVADKNPEQVESSSTAESPAKKASNENATEEQKSAVGEEKKRVLRARDKARRSEKGQTSSSRERNDNSKGKADEEGAQKKQNDAEEDLAEEKTDSQGNAEDPEENQNNGDLEANDLDSKARPRRSREPKKRKDDQSVSLKSKRPKREVRRTDQQNKEETLLDNEVATINENNRSFLNKYGSGAECAGNFRGFSEGGRGSLEKHKNTADSARSKSENDLVIAKEPSKESCEDRLSRNLSENHVTKQVETIGMLDVECKPAKTPETSQKDSDETSTSGESSSSVNVAVKILETPEDKAKKESILRLLGLESLEKAAERLNHQKAKKEQYTGTLKTVIRVQKEKERDKRRSRSPLKMVLKQGRGDGEGDSPEFYTIQKEFGTSGLGDSSSGANRKFSTNHRHSCDEDNEDAAPKDRQSLVIPEKSSSFSIHPGRLCADVCCYCFGKFGSLDTPMHLAQMKSDERRKKILNIERHLTKDSCLCDACYRHVDRKANTSPTNMQTKPQKQHRQLMVSKCSARDCRDAARHHVKRRWLLKIKAGLQKQVDIDWESSQHTSMSFCVSHYSKIERFLTCALCKRRLARNYTHQLANAETNELNQLLGQQGIPVVLAAGTFVCKLCRYFTQLQLKYKDVENMNASHRSFFKNYRKRILHYHNIEVLDNEDDELSSQNQSKDKEKRKKNKCPAQSKSGTTKSPDATANSMSEKSTPELTKVGAGISETDNENNRTAKTNSTDEVIVPGDVQFLGIESTVEKLKKRKLLEMHPYTGTDVTIPCESPNEVVEILAMDKEVTLTRLPKRPRTSNDITPVVQRLGANPSISVRTLFPGEEEMNLHANIEFANVREITPQGWEKCATMIQYDRDTKLLWQELQRPYGNQSSFLRHLILLEKYYRSGDLVLAPNASRNAINYSTSVQNRLISYEGPEKMDEPIMEPIASEYNSRRLSGGYVLERDRLALPGTSAMKTVTTTTVSQQSAKSSPSRVLKLNSGVSIIKKPPPNLQRLNLPSTSNATNGNAKRKDGGQKATPTTFGGGGGGGGGGSGGGKVFQMSEPEFKRLQTLKKQKQLLTEKSISGGVGVTGTTGVAAGTSSSSPPNLKSTQYQKAQQLAAHTQFQKHLRMQQEMLSRQSRGDFEPLICDVRSLANENTPTQNLLHNLNLPKSIQVTTKSSSNQIPILPKIPKSLTVIPQTVTRPAADK